MIEKFPNKIPIIFNSSMWYNWMHEIVREIFRILVFLIAAFKDSIFHKMYVYIYVILNNLSTLTTEFKLYEIFYHHNFHKTQLEYIVFSIFTRYSSLRISFIPSFIHFLIRFSFNVFLRLDY